jgi:hypothetical protein
MKVFVSWSGTRSRKVAEFLKEWLPCVLQAVKPWISTKDLDRGTVWFRDIYERLKEMSLGIVCLTHENKDRPWVLFEAGALAKGLEKSRVCTFLVDLKPKDVGDPLAQFNHTTPDRDSVLALLSTLNGALDGERLEPQILERTFATFWPQFEKEFAACLENTDPAVEVKPRPAEDLLAEILENTRSISSRILALEKTRDQPEDALEADMQARKDTLMALEVTKMLKEGMPESEVLHRVARLVGPPERVAWIMNRGTRGAAAGSQRPTELASGADVYGSALRELERSGSRQTTKKKGG